MDQSFWQWVGGLHWIVWVVAFFYSVGIWLPILISPLQTLRNPSVVFESFGDNNGIALRNLAALSCWVGLWVFICFQLGTWDYLFGIFLAPFVIFLALGLVLFWGFVFGAPLVMQIAEHGWLKGPLRYLGWAGLGLIGMVAWSVIVIFVTYVLGIVLEPVVDILGWIFGGDPSCPGTRAPWGQCDPHG
jgi:hypothetical protein